MTAEILHGHVLAYLAGIIDADGTIGITKSTYALRRWGRWGPVFYPHIGVKQVEPHAVTLLKETFGGGLYRSNPSAPNGRPLLAWRVTNRKAEGCLQSLLPFLRIKKGQAENALRLYPLLDQSGRERAGSTKGEGAGGGRARSPELTAAMEAIYLAGKTLNRVGTGAQPWP